MGCNKNHYNLHFTPPPPLTINLPWPSIFSDLRPSLTLDFLWPSSLQALVEANKLSDRITILAGKIEELQVPEQVDIIISEPMGYMLFNERMLESYLHAKKFLKPGGEWPEIRGQHWGRYWGQHWDQYRGQHWGQYWINICHTVGVSLHGDLLVQCWLELLRPCQNFVQVVRLASWNIAF